MFGSIYTANSPVCGEIQTVECSTTAPPSKAQWYAVRTQSRKEKAAAARLSFLGVSHYLPISSEVRQWSDRKQSIQVPLFPGYLFVHVDVWSGSKLEVLTTPGVVGFVGNTSGPLAIPDNQIESVRKALCYGKDCSSRPLLHEGDSVRIVRGALAGIQGTLQRDGSKSTLIIAIEMIQRSVAVALSTEDVESVSTLN